MNPFWQIFLFALIPVATMIVGGAVAVWRPPNAKWRSAILHFAAGVVFSVVAVELLPDVVSRHRPLEVAIGFGLGVAVPLGLRAWSQRKAKDVTGATGAESEKAAASGLLFGVGVDITIDGLLLGIGFAAGAKEGVLLTLALAVELLSLGLATAAALGAAGATRARNLAMVAGLALLFLVGAGAGATLLAQLSAEWLELVLSFGLAALLFLVTEELLVEAHEEPESPLLTATFFGGFLLFLLLGMSG